MTDADEPTQAQKLHSDVLARVDGSGGTLTALFTALHAAGEAGHHIESAEDRATDIDAHLDRAMESVDTTDPDPEEVLDYAESAATAASRFRRGLDGDLAAYEVPDHVDIGVYETLGEYAKHVEQSIIGIREYAEEWETVAE